MRFKGKPHSWHMDKAVYPRCYIQGDTSVHPTFVLYCHRLCKTARRGDTTIQPIPASCGDSESGDLEQRCHIRRATLTIPNNTSPVIPFDHQGLFILVTPSQSNTFCMMSDTPKPKPVPNINLPKGAESCELFAINSTCDIISIPNTLVEPPIKGHGALFGTQKPDENHADLSDWLNLPTITFYIKHPSGAEVAFDLGCRTDWKNHAPHVVEVLSKRVPGLRVEKEVPDILKEGGVDPNKLKALILSHWYVCLV